MRFQLTINRGSDGITIIEARSLATLLAELSRYDPDFFEWYNKQIKETANV